MTDKVEDKEKKQFKSIIIVFSILIIFFIIGYIIGLMLVPRQEEDIVLDNDVVNYEINDSKIVDLMNNLVGGYPCSYLEYYTNNNEVTSKDIPNELLYRVTERYFVLNNTKTMSIEEFVLELKNHFDDGYFFDPEKINYNSGCFQYRYDSISSNYIKKEVSCDDTCSPNGTEFIITRAVEENNELKVYIKVLFGSEAEKIGFYSDYDRTKFVTDDYNKLDKYFYLGTDYVFKFKNIDNNYIFVSSDKM